MKKALILMIAMVATGVYDITKGLHLIYLNVENKNRSTAEPDATAEPIVDAKVMTDGNMSLLAHAIATYLKVDNLVWNSVQDLERGFKQFIDVSKIDSDTINGLLSHLQSLTDSNGMIFAQTLLNAATSLGLDIKKPIAIVDSGLNTLSQVDKDAISELVNSAKDVSEIVDTSKTICTC